MPKSGKKKKKPMHAALPATRLCPHCDRDAFRFSTTRELDSLPGMIGQQRAMDAIRTAVGIKRQGFNLFVLGPPGMGKFSAIMSYLKEHAASQRVPDDWCYVNDFKHPDRPRALRLPAATGITFRDAITQLLDDLRSAIPATLETEEFNARVQQLEQAFEDRQQAAFEELRERARSRDIKVFQTPGEFNFAPLIDGKTVEPEAYAKLPDEDRERISGAMNELQQQLEELIRRRIPEWRKETSAKIRALREQFTREIVGHLIGHLRWQFSSQSLVLEYLDEFEADVVRNAFRFQSPQQNEEGEDATSTLNHVYGVNLLVDHNGTKGAPVIYDDNPGFVSLIGRIEHTARMGALLTDVTMIRAGSLHRANGGYLILDAQKLLTQPYAWEALKRALRAGEIKVESLAESLSLISTQALQPQAIELDVKVVLYGDRLLYYLLVELDQDFSELFKIPADFEMSLPRSADNEQLYARLLATLIERERLRPFERDAVLAVLDHAMRLAGDRTKLTMHMRSITDLLIEADHLARQEGIQQVASLQVERALKARIRRVDRIREEMQDSIERGHVLIDVEGKVIGQVNGLSVLQLGDFSFGLPSRITATTRLGDGDVLDIEREIDLGGPVHSKGVLILSSYLASRYAADQPLSMQASLAFEQSYAGVEGDSASLAELCALLSSLGRLPVHQSLALTGSVNQRGQVQAIGGVNEKIEGFFDTCRRHGLHAGHGVLIPAANVDNLLLRADVIEAVEAGHFAIYAIDHVDTAMEILTGKTAGARGADGNFPENTINERVQTRLIELASLHMAFAGTLKADAGKVGSDNTPSEN